MRNRLPQNQYPTAYPQRMDLITIMLFSIAGGILGAWILITIKNHTN